MHLLKTFKEDRSWFLQSNVYTETVFLIAQQRGEQPRCNLIKVIVLYTLRDTRNYAFREKVITNCINNATHLFAYCIKMHYALNRALSFNELTVLRIALVSHDA